MRSCASSAGGCPPECRLLEHIYGPNGSAIFNQSDSCTALLYQLTKNCTADAFNVSTGAAELREPPTQTEVWGYGFLFMTLITSASLAGALVLPLRKKPIYEGVLMFLVSLAMGCLIGNGLFVLVPEAFEIVDHELYLWKSLTVLMGVYAFYVMEQVMGMVAGRRGCFRTKGNREQSIEKCDASEEITVHADVAPHLYHSHHHRHQPQYLEAAYGFEKEPKLLKDDSSSLLVSRPLDGCDVKPPQQPRTAATDSQNNVPIAEKCADRPGSPTEKPAVATIAYMVLIGHAVHNFIDGMSIGAAFASDKLLGISLSLAIFVEEVPHGLGDFAVLLNSGMSKKKAMLYNVLSSCPCHLGLVAGIKLSEVAHAAPWILGIAGGIFIYISLVDLLPEMKAAEENSTTPLTTFLVQNVGIISGVAIIVAMSTYGKKIHM